MDNLQEYLARFGHGKISNQELWDEMDRIWDELKLDNKIPLNQQDIGAFYSHPVWILNGLFSEEDPVSNGHRKAVADYVNAFFQGKYSIKVADFGGGSGVLGKIFVSRSEHLEIFDVVEPWPSQFFLDKNANIDRLRYVPEFSGTDYYDVVIAQDVLEHVNNPIDVAFECFAAAKVGGLIIFANCFYPHIKCHLPGNFYLRHTFKYVVGSSEIKFLGLIPGAPHMQVFSKTEKTNYPENYEGRNRIAKLAGPLLIKFNPFTVVRKILRRV
jgi:2-polyprenyl-6-hydroxyphenyl methylase/3-demethylubiquinone-9 3-methyltransferase